MEWGSRLMGSDINWWKLCKVIRTSKCVTSTVAWFSFYYDEDLAIQPSRITINNEFDETVLLNRSSQSNKKSFRFSVILNWRPVENINNKSFAILQGNFTSHASIRFDSFTSQKHGDSCNRYKYHLVLYCLDDLL